MATVEEQLASVQAAIAKIEGGGQSYTINGMTFTRANLQTLYDREKSLLARVSTTSTTAGGGGRNRVSFS